MEETKVEVAAAAVPVVAQDEGETAKLKNKDVSREQEELAAANGSLQTEESVLDEEDEEEEEEDDNDNVIVAITHEDMDADDDEEDVESKEGAVSIKDSMDNDQWLRYLDETNPTHRLRSLCKRGDLEALKEFLASPLGAQADVDEQCKDGWTSLHEIITHECQFTEVARLLVEEGGASVNTRDANGDSPLHSALLYHNADNIRLLLRAGADQSVMNNAGRMPVHVADDADSLAILLQDGAGNIANLKVRIHTA